MKPSLVLRMGQQLTMTPQLQQAIRLLQLSTLDLQQEIQEALESNPMLERQEEGDDFDNADPLADNIEQKPNTDVQEPSYQETAPTVDNLEEGEWNAVGQRARATICVYLCVCGDVVVCGARVQRACCGRKRIRSRSLAESALRRRNERERPRAPCS